VVLLQPLVVLVVVAGEWSNELMDRFVVVLVVLVRVVVGSSSSSSSGSAPCCDTHRAAAWQSRELHVANRRCRTEEKVEEVSRATGEERRGGWAMLCMMRRTSYYR
jgi:hypothetical protein